MPLTHVWVEPMETVPFTAWEQAVFVSLFIVFVGALLAWFTKQNDKWQRFIAEIEEKWRQFSREQRQENNACMGEVKQSLIDLTHVTQGLVAEVREMRADSQQFYQSFHEHDAQAKALINEVKANGKAAPKTTTRKPKAAE